MIRHLIYIGPLAAMLLFLLLSMNDWSTASAVTASVTLLCATWWVFEPVPRRIAMYMVNIFGGGSARGLVLGFMAAAAVLSMWISNTATTLMLLPS
jgi:sodium-dependent dicarboxylate transporter 2/3/5